MIEIKVIEALAYRYKRLLKNSVDVRGMVEVMGFNAVKEKELCDEVLECVEEWRRNGKAVV